MHVFVRALRGFLILPLFALALAGAASAHEFKLGALEIDHPWSRATVPAAKVAAGYLIVRNSGAESDRLLSVTSEIAGSAEVHEMAVDAAGVMTMRPVAAPLEIPAGGEAKLAPKGLHIMFTGLKGQLKEGEKFKATLAFEKAGSIDVEFAVEAMGSDHDDHQG